LGVFWSAGFCYLFDTASIFLLTRDFLGIGLHIFALFFIFNGFAASRKLHHRDLLNPIPQAVTNEPIV
jgi:hypothetical protein